MMWNKESVELVSICGFLGVMILTCIAIALAHGPKPAGGNRPPGGTPVDGIEVEVHEYLCVELADHSLMALCHKADCKYCEAKKGEAK